MIMYIAIAALSFAISFRIPIKWISLLLRITTIATVALLIFFAIQIPTSCTINENEIIVKQIVGKKTFIRSEVKLDQIDATVLKNSVRYFGLGGTSGYIGWFKNPTLGKFYMIASDTKDLLLIQTDTRKYVINCPGEQMEKDK